MGSTPGEYYLDRGSGRLYFWPPRAGGHYSRRARTYKPAISGSGVCSRIAHNLIHDGPHMALSAGGNDHVVEFNEIHNVVEESGDAGAYHVGRDWTQRGNVLRYNYWHDILGSTGYGGMTIYLDDQHGGHSIHGKRQLAGASSCPADSISPRHDPIEMTPGTKPSR